MHKKLGEIEFTIFDTETTGLCAGAGDRIIEIAALRFEGKRAIAQFSSLINPQREVSPAAYAVNRISRDMIKDAPLAKDVLPRFLDFIEGSCLCSYNASFDMEFIKEELSLIGACLPKDLIVVDALKMARRLLPGQDRYALSSVVEKLGVKTKQDHRALADVLLTYDVFLRFVEMLQQKGIDDFDKFVSLFGINATLLDDINNRKVGEIQKAIDKKISIKIKYLGSTDAQLSERIVVPRQVRETNNKFYLIGYCSLKKDERTFRVDNIIDMEMVP